MKNFLVRVWNFFFGWLGLKIGELEVTAPEVVYQNSIRELVQRHKTAKEASSRVALREKRLKKRKAEIEEALTQTESDLNAAIDQDKDELAEALLEKKETEEADLLEVDSDLEEISADVEASIKALGEIKSAKEKLERDKDRMIAKLRNAEAKQELRDAFSGMADTPQAEALANVRERIEQKVASVEFDDRLESSSLEGQLRELRQNSSKDANKAKLAALKAARKSKQAS